MIVPSVACALAACPARPAAAVCHVVRPEEIGLPIVTRSVSEERARCRTPSLTLRVTLFLPVALCSTRCSASTLARGSSVAGNLAGHPNSYSLFRL